MTCLLLCVLYSQQAMAKRPVSAVGNRRPITEYAKMAAAMGGHMRYKVQESAEFKHNLNVT